jgi:hypothetical protein
MMYRLFFYIMQRIASLYLYRLSLSFTFLCFSPLFYFLKDGIYSLFKRAEKVEKNEILENKFLCHQSISPSHLSLFSSTVLSLVFVHLPRDILCTDMVYLLVDYPVSTQFYLTLFIYMARIIPSCAYAAALFL